MLINNSWHIISPQKGLAILITGASFPGASVVKNLPANARDVVDVDSIPGSRRSPGGGNGNPLQHSCLENPMDDRSLAGYSPQGQKRVGQNLATKQQQQRIVFKNMLIFQEVVNFT